MGIYKDYYKFLVFAIILILLNSTIIYSYLSAYPSNVEIINGKDTIDVVRSMVRLADGRILFVEPGYVNIPDRMFWGIISNDGLSIEEYSADLPDYQVIDFIRVDSSNTVIGVAVPDTSYTPSGPMAIYKYDLVNNAWVRLFKYQGSYYRIDPRGFVFVEQGYIVSGRLMSSQDSTWDAFIARFTETGELMWIKTFVFTDYDYVTAQVFRYGENLYAFIYGTASNGSVVLLRLIKLSPSDGSYTVICENDNGRPFLFKDNNNMYETVGLIKDYQVKIYFPANNTWRTYELQHDLYGSPYEGEAIDDLYTFAYSDSDKNVYQVVITSDFVAEEYIDFTHSGRGYPINVHYANNYIVVTVGQYPNAWPFGHVIVYKLLTLTFTKTITETTTETTTNTETITSTITTTIIRTTTRSYTSTTTRTITSTITRNYTLTYTVRLTRTSTVTNTITRTIPCSSMATTSTKTIIRTKTITSTKTITTAVGGFPDETIIIPSVLLTIILIAFILKFMRYQ